MEEKGTFVLDYKNRARDHANGVLKSQANVAVQGSSTSTSASSTQTLQFLMALVAKEKNCTNTWYINTDAIKYLTS
jgi:hypothetical protein